ncbi:MAG: hypothetical protein EBR82_42905 [Caulobacteraceae bacterium]|nr:hypothetical protein [Caulobacteraceae bacterium]
MKTQYPKILRLKLSEIQGAGYNPRKITSEAMGRLTKSVADLGDLQPITINVRTGNRIIGGHQRFKIYQAMGRDEIDVWAVDLPEDKEKVANLAPRALRPRLHRVAVLERQRTNVNDLGHHVVPLLGFLGLFNQDNPRLPNLLFCTTQLYKNASAERFSTGVYARKCPSQLSFVRSFRFTCRHRLPLVMNQ